VATAAAELDVGAAAVAAPGVLPVGVTGRGVGGVDNVGTASVVGVAPASGAALPPQPLSATHNKTGKASAGS